MMNASSAQTLLKDAISELKTIEFSHTPPNEAAISRLKLPSFDNPIDKSKPLDLDKIAKEIVEIFAKGGIPERRDVRHSAFCIWETKPRLIDDQRALDNYLKFVSCVERKADFRRLAEAYVRCFDLNLPGIEKVANVLAEAVERVKGKWLQRSQEYQIFDTNRGPNKIAQIALSQDVDPVHFFCERDQWPESLARARFAQHVWFEGIKIIDKETQDERDRFDRLIQWNGSADNELLFPSLKAHFIETLVKPYEKGGPEDKSLRDAILNFLLGTLGDPRLDAQKWVGLDEAMTIVNRWLVEQSFRQFLDIVEKISANENQWDYRRAFWEALYRKCQERKIGLRAWVVLAEKGARAARQLFGSNASFGILRDSSQALLDSHAAFMLEIGDYLFVDWNESGPCNIWRKHSGDKRPKLYQSYYRRGELRHNPPAVRTDENLIPAGIFNHRGSTNYVWQQRLSKEISAARGPRLYQTDYRVINR